MIYFLIWLLCLYYIHKLAHKSTILSKYHKEHHKVVTYSLKYNKILKWKFSNLFLYTDNRVSTIDLWLTEVIPTIIFSYITDQWWIFIFYYLWAAFIQETVEHNPKIDLPFLTMGKWHVAHHKCSNSNYGLFFPVWDIVFGTYKKT